MSSDRRDLGWLKGGGSPRELGFTLGRAGREVVHARLVPSRHWREITSSRHASRVASLSDNVGRLFPAIRAEIEGLADGLGLPFPEVMAWNCRGELRASSPDGCTTVMLPGEAPVLAHNEDGLPFFRGHCFIVDATPEGAPPFFAFCYPGSIPGHTFACNGAGLVQCVNNLRLLGFESELPRMVIGRAVLGAETLEAAVGLLRAHCRTGGFHFALSHARDRRILSVEFGAGEVLAREVDAPEVHANHALRHAPGLARQIVTASSGDRQARGDALIAAGDREPLRILRDTGGSGLPIRRDAPDDPDDENTLATAVFHVGENGIDWSIHDRSTGGPAYEGQIG